MAFRIGQKVARVGGKHTRPFAGPAIGEPCTVTGMYVDADGDLHLLLAEYPSSHPNVYDGWLAQFFRPIVERKTDISIFTRMLDTKHVEAVQ